MTIHPFRRPPDDFEFLHRAEGRFLIDQSRDLIMGRDKGAPPT